MKLTLLGTGTPRPTAERQATANLVDLADASLLIDAGRGASTQMAKLGRDPAEVDFIFLTHHHFDHIAGLGDLLLSAWNDGRVAPVKVIGPEGSAAIIAHLWKIYCRDINFRLREAEFMGNDMPDLRKIVSVREMAPGEVFHGSDWHVTAYRVEHGHAMGLSHEEWPCFGYRLEQGGKVLAISGDTVDCAGARAVAKSADLLLQCCYMAEAEIDGEEKRLLAEHVLASARQAGRIAAAAGVKQVVLTHLSPKSSAMLQVVEDEVREEFSGTIVVGEDLHSFEV